MTNRKSKAEPLVSVLVPTYNRRSLLARTLDSILTGYYRNLEVIVVNDGGIDVLDVVAKFNDHRTRHYKNEKNLGLAGSRNVALNFSRGDYICLLDDDDIHLPYTLEFRVTMAKKLSAEIVYTRSLLDHWEKEGEGYKSLGKTLYWDSPFDKDLILIQNIAPCCNVMFSRKSWKRSNYWFDETMTTTEDHDFWIGLSRFTDFKELKLIDTECSKRTDNSQMTGTLNFVPNWIKTFKRWRHTAIDMNRVTTSQNNILKRAGVNPADHGL